MGGNLQNHIGWALALGGRKLRDWGFYGPVPSLTSGFCWAFSPPSPSPFPHKAGRGEANP